MFHLDELQDDRLGRLDMLRCQLIAMGFHCNASGHWLVYDPEDMLAGCVLPAWYLLVDLDTFNPGSVPLAVGPSIYIRGEK